MHLVFIIQIYCFRYILCFAIKIEGTNFGHVWKGLKFTPLWFLFLHLHQSNAVMSQEEKCVKKAKQRQ